MPRTKKVHKNGFCRVGLQASNEKKSFWHAGLQGLLGMLATFALLTQVGQLEVCWIFAYRHIRRKRHSLPADSAK